MWRRVCSRGLGGAGAGAGARGVATAQLPPRAEVVVVGGGVTGASTAYHLARHQGVAGTLLLEAEQVDT